MNVLSIDVGIKNLAYCLFFIHQNKYEINQWGVIDLSDSKKKCKEKKKNGTVCGKNAKFFKNNQYYCKIHAKNKNYKIPTTDLKQTSIKKKKIIDLKKLANRLQIKYHKKIKKKEIFELIQQHLQKHYFSFYNTINSKDINIVTLGIKLKNKFDEILKNIPLHHIIIENQISPIANRMKTLQGMIIQHFIEDGHTNIKEISAINKLKEFLGEHQKTSYNERKKIGIQSCTQIICTNNYFNKWDKYFLSHKKKDDLADSFLQGWWYLKNQNLINLN